MPFCLASSTISGARGPGSLPILPSIIPQVSLSIDEKRGLFWLRASRFISAVFFTYWLKGVTSGGYPRRGHTYSTSLNSLSISPSRVLSGLPLARSEALIAALKPLRSAIIEPIIPPGSPQPTSSEVILALLGLIQ